MRALLLLAFSFGHQAHFQAGAFFFAPYFLPPRADIVDRSTGPGSNFVKFVSRLIWLGIETPARLCAIAE